MKYTNGANLWEIFLLLAKFAKVADFINSYIQRIKRDLKRFWGGALTNPDAHAISELFHFILRSASFGKNERTKCLNKKKVFVK